MDEHGSNPFRRAPRGGQRRPKQPEKPGEKRRGLRQLPADLNDLAEGRVNRLRRPRPPPAVLEEETGGVAHVLPGVRNSDARAVYDRRVTALRRAVERDDVAALETGLCEAECLALWRARNVTDFDAFAEHVVGLGIARARELADCGAARLGENPLGRELRPLGRELVALWVRTEAALITLCATAWVRVAPSAAGPQLELRLPANPVPTTVEALRALGPALMGLAKLTSVEVPEAPPRRKR